MATGSLSGRWLRHSGRAAPSTGLDPLAPAAQWKGAAHGLKGAARGIGAVNLGDLAETAEGLSAAEERRALLVRLLAEVEEVRRQLDALQ
jgi:HPt (histidine-containing phosphotransfer) domain-containing protein